MLSMVSVLGIIIIITIVLIECLSLVPMFQVTYKPWPLGSAWQP